MKSLCDTRSEQTPKQRLLEASINGDMASIYEILEVSPDLLNHVSLFTVLSRYM
jgi:hypothetical protein